MAESNKITFGYWGTRGKGQIVRFLLEYTGLSYENKFYYTFEEWGNDKFSLGFDFPNLPYIIDGDFKLTESLAILKWIAVKANKPELNGKNDKDQIQVQSIMGVLEDIWREVLKIVFGPKDGWDNFKTEEIGKFSFKLASLSKYLGEKDWLLGYLTTADVQLAYIVDILNKMEKDLFKDWKNLTELQARFYNLDNIKNYLASDRIPKIYFPPMATWSCT